MPTEMTPPEWDRQFTRQASWTRATRSHLYRRSNLCGPDVYWMLAVVQVS